MNFYTLDVAENERRVENFGVGASAQSITWFIQIVGFGQVSYPLLNSIMFKLTD